VVCRYVALVTPVRAAFERDTALWSSGFWVDAVIDVFFIVDVCLNFRTAYYTRSGVREARASKMAQHYLRGWFFIDFISCLPVGYIMYFYDDASSDASSSNSSNARILKIARLIRLSKMLRLARIKRILSKWGKHVNFQQYHLPLSRHLQYAVFARGVLLISSDS
jgi:hypothetical protein